MCDEYSNFFKKLVNFQVHFFILLVCVLDDNELKSLREQIKEKENTIDELKSDCEEKEKDFKSMYEKLQADMKEQRNEKNILKMVCIIKYDQISVLLVPRC